MRDTGNRIHPNDNAVFHIDQGKQVTMPEVFGTSPLKAARVV